MVAQSTRPASISSVTRRVTPNRLQLEQAEPAFSRACGTPLKASSPRPSSVLEDGPEVDLVSLERGWGWGATARTGSTTCDNGLPSPSSARGILCLVRLGLRELATHAVAEAYARVHAAERRGPPAHACVQHGRAAPRGSSSRACAPARLLTQKGVVNVGFPKWSEFLTLAVLVRDV